MTDVDWFVIIAALGAATAAVSWYGYRRWHRLVLTPADLEFAVVDALPAAGFTRYCAALARLLGYQQVRRVRGSAVSLTAAAPDGAPVAIRCALQRDPVAVEAVRELGEALKAGRYAGRAGILVTNARVTPQAREFAGDAGITVADRAVLRHWMEQARGKWPGGAPVFGAAAAEAAPVASAARARAMDARVMAGVVGCAALALIAVAIHAATGAAVPSKAAANVAAVSARAAVTPTTTVIPAGTASPPGAAGPDKAAGPASTASPANGSSAGRHEWHVKHVEHMRHLDFVEHLGAGH
jgi:hypothetical protein